MVVLRIAAIVASGLLIGCTDRSISPVTPDALLVGTPKTIFAATNREELPDGSFGPERSDTYSLLELTVSIPPNHKPGTLEFSYANPDPKTQFTLATRHKFEDPADFDQRIREELNKLAPTEREVSVFVHGFNSTQTETAFRAAQLTHDIETPGLTVIYSWPSLGSPLGYAYDGDSILFARDGLENLLRHLRRAGAENIILTAHSMGSVLTMETLRQIEIKTPDWSQENLGGVVLMSPDLDLDVFRSQMRRFENVPQPFVVFVSSKDTVLNISQRLRGTHSRERLGNLASVDAISDLPIEIFDTTDFSDDAGSGHFVTATSPALLSLLNQAALTREAFEKTRTPTSITDVLPQQVLNENQVDQISVVTFIGGER